MIDVDYPSRCRICWVSKYFENAWRHVGLDFYYLLRLPPSVIEVIYSCVKIRNRKHHRHFLKTLRVTVWSPFLVFLPSYNPHWSTLPAHSLRPSVICVKFNVLNAVKPTPAVSNCPSIRPSEAPSLSPPKFNNLSTATSEPNSGGMRLALNSTLYVFQWCAIFRVPWWDTSVVHSVVRNLFSLILIYSFIQDTEAELYTISRSIQ